MNLSQIITACLNILIILFLGLTLSFYLLFKIKKIKKTRMKMKKANEVFWEIPEPSAKIFTEIHDKKNTGTELLDIQKLSNIKLKSSKYIIVKDLKEQTNNLNSTSENDNYLV